MPLNSSVDHSLPITSIIDGIGIDLTDAYHRPIVNQLAAASTSSERIFFPITVVYAEGQVIGQFLKRAGQLFFRLSESAINNEKSICTLVYNFQ